MRLGIAAYVVPFVFALHPALILKGAIGEIFLAVIASAIGTFLLAVGCAGFLFRNLDLPQALSLHSRRTLAHAADLASAHG